MQAVVTTVWKLLAFELCKCVGAQSALSPGDAESYNASWFWVL